MKFVHFASGCRLYLLASGLMFTILGCSGPTNGETTPEIAKAQEGESSAWAKVKAEGKDQRKSSQAQTNPGGRGFVNRPGS
jgi:hypothetical protein